MASVPLPQPLAGRAGSRRPSQPLGHPTPRATPTPPRPTRGAPAGLDPEVLQSLGVGIELLQLPQRLHGDQPERRRQPARPCSLPLPAKSLSHAPSCTQAQQCVRLAPPFARVLIQAAPPTRAVRTFVQRLRRAPAVRERGKAGWGGSSSAEQGTRRRTPPGRHSNSSIRLPCARNCASGFTSDSWNNLEAPRTVVFSHPKWQPHYHLELVRNASYRAPTQT